MIVAINRGRALAYPPVPITNSGAKSLNSVLSFINETIILKGRMRFFVKLSKLISLCNPLIGKRVCNRSFTGKTFASRPISDPTKCIFASGIRSFISSPIAIAGNKCPPVPPPAIIIL